MVQVRLHKQNEKNPIGQVTYENNEVDYIDQKLSKEDIKKFKVQFPKLPQGSHDILIIASRNPDFVLEKKQIISFPNTFIQRRLRLIVQNDTTKKYETFMLKDIRSVPSNQIIPFLSLKPNDDITNMESLTPKSNLPTMWFNFGTGASNSYAIVALSNNKQININKILKVQPHTQVSIPVNQIINIGELENDLILCIIPSPYQKLEDDRGNIADIDFPRFLNKITIE